MLCYTTALCWLAGSISPLLQPLRLRIIIETTEKKALISVVSDLLCTISEAWIITFLYAAFFKMASHFWYIKWFVNLLRFLNICHLHFIIEIIMFNLSKLAGTSKITNYLPTDSITSHVELFI